MKISLTATLSGVLAFSLPAWAAPISGRIVDANQKPVAGASVRVWPIGGGKAAPQNLTTDANGAFTADLPDGPRPQFKGISRGLADVRVVAPNMTLAEFYWDSPDQIFALAPGKSWSGIVLDENEKPVAGVRVSISDFRIDGKPTYLRGDKPSALTGADGKWKIDNLPLRGSARVVISDARFQSQGFDLPLSKTLAPPLFVRPGATVRGRLLKPDGTPLVGARINGSSDDFEEIRTDEAGRFTVSGLAPGGARLSSSDWRFLLDKAAPPSDYIVTSFPVEPLTAGETRDIGDWKAQSGTLVTGQILDKDTKKPIAGAQVWLLDKAASSTAHFTDKNGRYQVRVSDAGANSATFSDDDHLSHRLNSLSIPKGAATFELPVIELERGIKVSGTTRLEDNGALSNFSLSAKGKNRQTEVAQGDSYAKGGFSFRALSPGEYTLSAGSHYAGDNNRFELISPKSFTIPPVGQKMPPLEVVLKPLPGEEKVLSRLTGRVVDESGRGVAGAIVSLKEGNNVYPTLAVSSDDGTYEISDLAPSAKLSVSGVLRPGYVAARAPKIERQGELLSVADYVLKKRGARFAGRVVDAGGKPVAGAWVAPLELEEIREVKTAADGTFTLPDLPAGDFTLLAAKDNLSALLPSGADAKNVELKLAPPATIDTNALVEKWIARGAGYWSEDDFDNGIGAARMEQLARRGSTDAVVDARTATWLAWFVAAAAQHDADWTRQNATRLLSLFPEGESKKAAESAVAPLRAASDDAAEQKTAREWLQREKAEAGGISEATVSRTLSMARVARVLKSPEADGLLEFSAQIGAQLSAKTQLSSAMKWGRQLAPFGESALENFIEEWEAPARLAALSGATRGFAEMDNIESAQRTVEKLDALADTPEIRTASAKETQMRNTTTTPALVVDSAHSALVRALSERDPAAALTQSANIDESFSRQNAVLWVANGARIRGDKATATKALRQVFEFNIGNTEPYALAAWYGAQVDAALGEELFAKARERVERKSSYGSQPSIGDVAYYLARRDPAQSRILVEREWNERSPSFGQKSDEIGGGLYNRAATKLVRAMLVIDPARALEMATWLESSEAETPDPGRQRQRERTGWISAILADETAQARGDLTERY